MKRESFTKLCLLTSVIGLTIMYASTQVIKPQKVSIDEISRQDIGETYRVTGEVTDFYSTESVSFFKLHNRGKTISVTDFQKHSFSNGQKLVVTGEVDLYQGRLQMVSTRIEQR